MKYLAIAVLLFANISFAQQVVIEGMVKDSLSKPLEMANVLLKNPETGAIVSYAVTNYEGRFVLKGKTGTSYELSASYLGYRSSKEVFTIKEDDPGIIKNIVLYENVNQLDGVEVVQKMPVTLSGDTIIYKADAFTNGKERKLENILEKLPGFEIDESGEVKVQGKKVNNLLVEGKKFFDGNTKLATKNIPADAVDKVEVVQDYNEVSPLKGLDNEENLALNIRLKEGKKNMLFGDIKASGGLEDRYTFHPNLFYYTSKANLNFIGDLNNTGSRSFSFKDYLKFNSGIKNITEKSGTTFLSENNDIGLASMQNNRAKELITQLGAFNFTYVPGKKWSFSGFGIASKIKTIINSLAHHTYLRDDGNVTEAVNSDTDQRTVSGIAKISSVFTPKKDVYISYDGFLKSTDATQLNQRLSGFNTVENAVKERDHQRPLIMEQSLRGYLTKNVHHIFSLELNHRYSKLNPLYHLQTSQPSFPGIFPDTDKGTHELLQQKNTVTRNWSGIFKYYRILNGKNHINITGGIQNQHQNLVSDISRVAENNPTKLEGNAWNNDVQFRVNDVFISARYKTKLGRLIMIPGVSYHYYQWKNRQLNKTFTSDRHVLLPDFYARFNFKRSESISLNYNMKTQFPKISQLALGTTIQGYNILFQGNEKLNYGYYHQLGLSYNLFDSFYHKNINMRFNYQKKFDDILNDVTYSGNNSLLTVINANSANEIVSASGSYDKRYTFMRFHIMANISHSKYHNSIEGIQNTNTSLIQNYKASATTNFSELPNVTLGFQKIFNTYSGADIKNKFITHQPFAKLEWGILKYFTLLADYEYNVYKNRGGTTKSSYEFLNIDLYYQHDDSPWEFQISAANILNTKSIRRDQFSDAFMGTYQYVVLPRYILFGITYQM
ncbi:carboxypeptidase regulatory-like domain-containing protein [Sinomicrobium weinanense]|uniref:Carboxypeptidase-like regulatory domain-containing protein n=1 Tax=Sinomicrobium weinanense TaxID=2842200 RepID=A0A926JRU8_9FLAO|nr:carboxypeptidase-like regulatory domain-containing protein [Sinomicrobium weinanense]MBC9796128.1 carboxypeptidase-like regulatory domain-containing protein [Sinomicrobium weinanense]MBU3121879.1 carboxypeptidase-like regulatory domain-containing protein [Sinomicrobium weinanense]